MHVLSIYGKTNICQTLNKETGVSLSSTSAWSEDQARGRIMKSFMLKQRNMFTLARLRCCCHCWLMRYQHMKIYSAVFRFAQTFLFFSFGDIFIAASSWPSCDHIKATQVLFMTIDNFVRQKMTQSGSRIGSAYLDGRILSFDFY